MILAPDAHDEIAETDSPPDERGACHAEASLDEGLMILAPRDESGHPEAEVLAREDHGSDHAPELLLHTGESGPSEGDGFSTPSAEPPPPDADLSCGFTVMECSPPLTASKRFERDALTGEIRERKFGGAKHFEAREVQAWNIRHLFEILKVLQGLTRAFILRGMLKIGSAASRCRRLLYDETSPDTGRVVAKATLKPCARRWAMMDFDISPIPEGIDPVARPDEALDHLVGRLPEEFREVTFVYQWSSSTGIRDKLAAHLFFWTSRPIPDRDLERWAKAVKNGLDPNVFRPVQPHYTAAPEFGRGLNDPVGAQRLGIREGLRDEVEIVIPTEDPAEYERDAASAGLTPSKGFCEHYRRIGPHGFHEPIKAAVGAYVREHGVEGTDPAALIASMRKRILSVDPGGRDEEVIKRYASEKFLRDIIDWTLNQHRRPRSSGTGPYRIVHGRIVFAKESPGGQCEETPLCNFSARIVREIFEDDGSSEVKRWMEIEGTLEDGSPLPVAKVLSAEFPSVQRWTLREWGGRAVVNAGVAAADRLREAIQRLSGTFPQETIYSHTGWRQINGEWVFLDSKGGLGAAGRLDGLKVQLEGRLRDIELGEPASAEEIRRALESVLHLGNQNVTLFLLAIPFRAALGQVVPIDFYIFLVGATQNFKSSVAGVLQCFFGTAFTNTHMLADWQATANFLEGIAFRAKDTIATIDDFAPGKLGRNEGEKVKAAFERFNRSIGNRGGRGRMRQDGTLRPSLEPRCLALESGEDIGGLTSVRARGLYLEFNRDTIDPASLSKAQKMAAEGVFARVTASFVQWLAPRIDELKKLATQEITAFRAQASRLTSLRRTPEVVAGLFYGLNTFLTFCEETMVLSAAEVATLKARFWSAALDVAADQEAIQQESDPVTRFVEVLEGLLRSGGAHLLDAKSGNAPAGALAYGWSKTPDFESLKPGGERLGWIEPDGSTVYLAPETTYAEVVRFAGKQNDSFPISKQRLWKALDERGMLRQRGKDHMTVPKVLGPGGKQTRVISLAWDGTTARPARAGTCSSTVGGQLGPGGQASPELVDGETVNNGQSADQTSTNPVQDGQQRSAEDFQNEEAVVTPTDLDHHSAEAVNISSKASVGTERLIATPDHLDRLDRIRGEQGSPSVGARDHAAITDEIGEDLSVKIPTGREVLLVSANDNLGAEGR